jgi:hypothetical protein
VLRKVEFSGLPSFLRKCKIKLEYLQIANPQPPLQFGEGTNLQRPFT